MSGKGNYLDRRLEELAAAKAARSVTAPAPDAPEMDLSKLQPKAASLPPPEVEEAVREQARARGFDREVGAQDPPPAPAETPVPKSAPAKASQPRQGKGRGRASAGQAAARYVVSMKERPPADIQGQALFTGNAQVLYEICRRAHYERRTRGELLADMLELYAEKHGVTPDKY